MPRLAGTPNEEIASTLGSEGLASLRLTRSERRLLALLTTSLSFREIAALLTTSRASVTEQAICIYRKLGIHDTTNTPERRSELRLVPSRR